MLPKVTVPVLVCAGKDEKRRSDASVKHVTELAPETRFELFEESGQSMTLKEPKKFNSLLRDFIGSLKLAT